MSDAERALDALLAEAHLAAPHHLPALVARHATTLGVRDAVIHLVDLQQRVLVPFLDPDDPGGRSAEPLRVDGTLAGRAFQHVEVLTQETDGLARVWLPLLDGTDRLGVLGLSVPVDAVPELGAAPLGRRLRRFTSAVAELVTTKTM